MKWFTIDELCHSATADKLGIRNIPTDDVIESLSELVHNVLDPAREMMGIPLIVNSGYRSYELNRAVGGVATSQHTKGEAADISAGSKECNKKLFDTICDRLQFDQLIDEHDLSWVHVSFRKRNNRNQVLKIG